MAINRKLSEFGGGPGQFDGVSSVEPLYPHLERQALMQVDGGKHVTTDSASKAIVSEPTYGTGGVKVSTELL